MTDALIVGGGLAGGALAAQLAEAGRSVVLLERESGPHDKVCGEFLSREAALYLKNLGLDLPALGVQRIDRVRLEAAGRVSVADLPFPALSLSRRVLDAALLDRAASAGAEIRMGARVASLARDAGMWRSRLRDGSTVDGSNAFLATGKHDLKGWDRPEGPQGDLIGFKLHWRLTAAQTEALAGYVELNLFPGGYAGLQPIEDGKANLCLLVRKSRFISLGQGWDALLAAVRTDCPLLNERLGGATPVWDRPLAIYAIPYGHIARTKDDLWRLGDQAAVIPSFAGDGMSIALHSAGLVARIYLEGGSPDAYRRQMSREIGFPVRLATMLSRMAMGALGRNAIGWGAAMLPGLMPQIAAATRVPTVALRRAGLDIAAFKTAAIDGI
jgi:flavin-dependent dehydrogenase